MANILDYIGEQISKLNTTIDDNSLLKDEGMFIIAKYVAKILTLYMGMKVHI